VVFVKKNVFFLPPKISTFAYQSGVFLDLLYSKNVQFFGLKKSKILKMKVVPHKRGVSYFCVFWGDAAMYVPKTGSKPISLGVAKITFLTLFDPKNHVF
jgi:hypothetical protein